jgi:DNA polymerase III alpha subunit
MAYAMLSWQCAYFLTYYPDEWIASYLDFASTGKSKSSSATKEDPKSVAIMEARSLGYKLGKPDINLSEDIFIVKEGKVLVPSFSAIKGVGKAALYEIKTHRPYKTVYDLIINPDGTWKHSKFNKKAFGNLIKTGAFESMDLVGEGTVFKNYKQMYTVFIEGYDELKRMSSRKKNNDVSGALQKKIEEVINTQPNDWTLNEKIEISKELTGNIDISLIVSPESFEYFQRTQTESIDHYKNEYSIYWVLVEDYQIKNTSTGKKYMRLRFHGESGVRYNANIWNINPEDCIKFNPNDIILARFKKDNWGFSAGVKDLRRLNQGKLEEDEDDKVLLEDPPV